MILKPSEQPTYILRITPEISVYWTAIGFILLFITVAIVDAYYELIHDRAWTFQLTTANQSTGQMIGQFLALIFLLIGTIAIHEAIHGIAFAQFGGSPRYGVGFQYLIPFAFATSPGDRFPRHQFLWIAIAPLLVLNLVSLLLLAIFPQATWLGLVIVLNTTGAVGDLWIVALLLRCPAGVTVEDRRSGVAIYVPETIDPRSLPFASSQTRSRSIWHSWLTWTLKALLILLGLILILLPLLTLLGVPSFTLGINDFYILRWENSLAGFGINFNLWTMLMVVALAGLVGIGQALRTRN